MSEPREWTLIGDNCGDGDYIKGSETIGEDEVVDVIEKSAYDALKAELEQAHIVLGEKAKEWAQSFQETAKYRSIVLKFINFYNEDYDPTIGNMPLVIYEEALAALDEVSK